MNREEKRRFTDIQLYDWIQEITEIECSKCHKKDVSYFNGATACEGWFESGWRATANNCYCPKCAKKYLTLNS